MTFFAIVFGGAIGWILGWYTGTHPGWTVPIVAWIKLKLAKKGP